MAEARLDASGSPWVPGTMLLATTFLAALPVPVWIVALSARSGTGPVTQAAEVVAAFAVGNLSALLAERLVSRGDSASRGACARWVVLGSLSLTFVSLLLVAMPFAVDGLRAAGVDDVTRWDGMPGLLRWWRCAVAFLLMVCAITSDGHETAEERAARLRARATHGARRPVRPVEARPAAIRARHPVTHGARG